MKFWKDGASYPFKSHDTWFMTENIRWGKYAPAIPTSRRWSTKVNREDIWREAAKDLGVAAPTFRPPPRAARRPSSTARSSTRKTRPPISTAWRSRPRPDRRLRRADGAPAFST
jgi:crotonobetainyl-CoA:carnitine CoA-transferase CaiB-like acyl-CoA transferase